MADSMTPEQRSRVMSHIRGKDTKPEMIVRRALHAAGFRYSLHKRRLPGCPDIVLARYRTAIFVNGCFWHGHTGCRYATKPRTNEEFWQSKIRTNIRRDETSVQYLEALGWRVATVWECELKASRREETISTLIAQIQANGSAAEAELSDRRRRRAEHREMLREARKRYEAVLEELEKQI